MAELPNKSIIAIEDIDSNEATKHRDAPKTEKISLSNISDILNSIDGVYSKHGCILIITTNHIDRLDPALIRSGRIDLKLEIGYADEYMMTNCMRSFYPDYSISNDFIIKDNVSSADIQNSILNNLSNPERVIAEFRR